MKWPWSKPTENRAEGYTDVVVQRLVAYAAGEVSDGLLAACEIAGGHWARAFASAELMPAGPVADAIEPHLSSIGRSLVVDGELVFAIEVVNGALTLLPASSYSITGDPTAWTYELTLPGPSTTITKTLTRDRVFHARYGFSKAEPWRGISPLESSGTTRRLLANLEARLGDETSGAVGAVIPVPQVSSTAQLQSDLRALRGEVTLVESVVAGWDAGETAAPNTDFSPKRIGANPPETLRGLRKDAEESILAAAGIPASVLGRSDGSLARESYRQFQHSVIAPVALDLARQIGQVFDVELTFSLDRLMATDLAARGRFVKQMTEAGFTLDQAARLAGFTES